MEIREISIDYGPNFLGEKQGKIKRKILLSLSQDKITFKIDPIILSTVSTDLIIPYSKWVISLLSIQKLISSRTIKNSTNLNSTHLAT